MVRVFLFWPFLQELGLRVLGADGLFIFNSLDTDHDFYLSPEEFKPIAEKLTGSKERKKTQMHAMHFLWYEQ